MNTKGNRTSLPNTVQRVLRKACCVLKKCYGFVHRDNRLSAWSLLMDLLPAAGGITVPNKGQLRKIVEKWILNNDEGWDYGLSASGSVEICGKCSKVQTQQMHGG